MAFRRDAKNRVCSCWARAFSKLKRFPRASRRSSKHSMPRPSKVASSTSPSVGCWPRATRCCLSPNTNPRCIRSDLRFQDSELTPDQQIAALLLKANILARMRRFSEAEQTLASLPPAAQRKPPVQVTHAQILLDGVAAALDRLPLRPDGTLPPELKGQVDQAIALLRELQAPDQQSSEVARRALYLLGRGAELQGDEPQALKLFTRVHQQFGDAPEGLAAKLSEADILRRDGDDRTALVLYRQVLQSGLDPRSYRSNLLPIDEIRNRMLEAVAAFSRDGLFDHVIALLDGFLPLFSRPQQLSCAAKRVVNGASVSCGRRPTRVRTANALRHSALRHLREAGVAFEQLAALRFATSNYPGDLWDGADCFYLGHSYTNAARLLDVYLKNEPERRNAQALLRLGQVDLALGRVDDCIAALEECIELYDRDNATYQARIDCAKAYWYRGDVAEAERLLRVNLTGSPLDPKSPEWKDSLFALGLLAVRRKPLRRRDQHARRGRRALPGRPPDAASPLCDGRGATAAGRPSRSSDSKPLALPANARRLDKLVERTSQHGARAIQARAKQHHAHDPQRAGGRDPSPPCDATATCSKAAVPVRPWASTRRRSKPIKTFRRCIPTSRSFWKRSCRSPIAGNGSTARKTPRARFSKPQLTLRAVADGRRLCRYHGVQPRGMADAARTT